MKKGSVRIIAVVVLAHVILLGAILFRPTKEVLPRANQPWQADPEPKTRFSVGEFTYVDPQTGDRYRETRYLVSTRLFMDEKTNESLEESHLTPKNESLTGLSTTPADRDITP